MRYARLGKSNLQVSRLGFDCESFGTPQRDKGWDPRSYDGCVFAMRTVNAALKAGINVFGIALDAGFGGESLLGDALRDKRDDIVIAAKLTKADGRLATNERIRSSLRRLRTDWFDIIYVNDKVVTDPIGKDHTMAVIRRLQKDGVIGHIGLLVTDPEHALPLISSGEFEVAQMLCDVTTQGPAWQALDVCRNLGMGVSIEKPVSTGEMESVGDTLGSEWSGSSDIRKCCFKYLLSDRRVDMLNVGMRWEHEVAENAMLFSGIDRLSSEMPVCA